MTLTNADISPIPLVEECAPDPLDADLGNRPLPPGATHNAGG
jgi:hypothetical protein